MKPVKTNSNTLKCGGDAEVAARLIQLIRDAEDGLLRMLKAGLYIEWIATQLPHGQLLSWVETHCPDISQRTLYRWRTMAKNVMEWCDFKFATVANLNLRPDLLLELPVEEIDAEVVEIREKIDDLLAGAKTAKQLSLFLTFKQAEETPDGAMVPKVGRAAGEGGRPVETLELAGDRAHKAAVAIAALVHTYAAGLVTMNDDEIEGTIAYLEGALNLSRRWLNTQPLKRDPKTISDLAATLPPMPERKILRRCLKSGWAN